jgi:hypothetical protein
MTTTWCILHKECHGCNEGLMYSARFYAAPVELHTPFELLPFYIGSCAIRILDNNAHLTRMVFMKDYNFEDTHHLDLCLRLLEAEPTLETATFERHKEAGEVRRKVRIVDRIRYLTRGS